MWYVFTKEHYSVLKKRKKRKRNLTICNSMDGPGGYCVKWTSSHRTVFPSGTSGKESYCQCRRHKRHGFNPWVGKIPWSRKWQPTSVFLPGEFHGQRSLAGYSPWGHKESDMTEHTSTQSRTNVAWFHFIENQVIEGGDTVAVARAWRVGEMSCSVGTKFQFCWMNHF